MSTATSGTPATIRAFACPGEPPMSSPQGPAQLPDVAFEAAALARPLDWVGMDRVAIPVRIHDADGQAVQVAADVDVAVDLRDGHARGIHMSRLYLQLQQAFASEA